MLNFLPKAVFYGQRPSIWWTHRHDVDLIIGTYKYGYANYNAMRADKSLSFHKVDAGEFQYNDFPNADNITRRLKKLFQILGKNEYQIGIKFDVPLEMTEPTGLTLREKELICQILSTHGLPLVAGDSSNKGDQKGDLNFLKEKVQKILKEEEKS